MTDLKRLLNRPVEKDTRILMEDLVDFGEFQGLMELWVWDGITGSTIILLEYDVSRFSNEDLLGLLFDRMKQPKDPQTTLSRTGEFVYVNYGFKVD